MPERMDSQSILNWKRAAHNAFHPGNGALLAMFLSYVALAAMARPVYYAKLSDHFDKIFSVADRSLFPKDLQVKGSVASRNLFMNQQEIRGILLGETGNDPSVLYLYPGQSVLPDEKQFCFFFVVSVKPGGSLRPGLMKLDASRQYVVYDFEETHGFELTYQGGTGVASEFYRTTLVTCAKKESMALVLLSKQVMLLDAFFFRVSDMRMWGRTPMLRHIDTNTGKYRPF